MKPGGKPQRSLWGGLLRRSGHSRHERKAPPVASAPTHRPLTAKDALWTVDTQGQRVYVPLVLGGEATGRYAGREWQHCGERDGVLLVVWHERYNPRAPLYWRPLTDGGVCVIEGGQAG